MAEKPQLYKKAGHKTGSMNLSSHPFFQNQQPRASIFDK
jgi:hypothetical protein